MSARFLRLLLVEIRTHICRLVFSVPGRTGIFIRSMFLGKKISVDPGCYLLGVKNIQFGTNVTIGMNCIFSAEAGKILIGNNSAFNSNVCLGADFGEIEIGNDVLVAMNVVIRAADHKFDQTPKVLIREQGHKGGKIQIGNDVWIGANTCVVVGATIGDHCVIGAGSVVVGDIPPNSLAVGSPARVIRSIGLSS